MEQYCGNSVVRQLLFGGNYEEWSFQVKHYLLARNQWDVVAKSRPKGEDQKFKLKAWKRKNSAALHAIRISCSSSILPLIKDINAARLAWATLANKCDPSKSQPQHQVIMESSILAADAPSPSDSNGGGFESHVYDSFFKAVHDGHWNEAENFLAEHPEAVTVRTPGLGKNALHIAVTKEHLQMVEGLLGLMTEADVEMERRDGFTALAAAVEVGNLEIAKCLVRKNKKLIGFEQQTYGLPVVHAVVTGQNHMVRYLYQATPEDDLKVKDEGRLGALLLSQCIFGQHFDIALHLLERAPLLAITDDEPGQSPVWALAHSKVFQSRSALKFWQWWIYLCIHIPHGATSHISLDIQNQQDEYSDQSDHTSMNFLRCKEVLLGLLQRWWSYLLKPLDINSIYETKLFYIQSLELLKRMCKVIEDTSDETKIEKAGVHDALIAAVCAGNVKFISRMVKANPTLVWNPEIVSRVFKVAVEHRQAKIFSLIHGLPDKIAIVSCRDGNDNNMLHKAAAVAPLRLLKLIPGAALQMQRELQWFKAVEELASPAARDWPNKKSLTPRALFTENHKDLVVEGEKWMKDTAGSSTVVGALIITMTFAAAFTYPGGNDQNEGYPMFIGKKLFKVFMMSNAIALFTSTTSVLMFMGILTSRYGEEDFLKSLPTKMIIGLSTLFLSIAAMIVAFVAGLSLMFREQLWIVVPSICLACIPISLFVLLQFHLLVDIFKSTYWPMFNRNPKRWI